MKKTRTSFELTFTVVSENWWKFDVNISADVWQKMAKPRFPKLLWLQREANYFDFCWKSIGFYVRPLFWNSQPDCSKRTLEPLTLFGEKCWFSVGFMQILLRHMRVVIQQCVFSLGFIGILLRHMRVVIRKCWFPLVLLWVCSVTCMEFFKNSDKKLIVFYTFEMWISEFLIFR